MSEGRFRLRLRMLDGVVGRVGHLVGHVRLEAVELFLGGAAQRKDGGTGAGKGIPILLLDTRIDQAAAQSVSAEVLTYIGSDNFEGGAVAGRYLAATLGGTGNVAVIEGISGHETADQAHHRFSQALASLLEQYLDQNVAVVAHGTVITLFVTRAVGLQPFAFWKRLGLPSFVVLSVPGFDILSVVEEVE